MTDRAEPTEREWLEGLRSEDKVAPESEQDDWRGVYPGHCIDPETCRGYTHCPRNYSCVE